MELCAFERAPRVVRETDQDHRRALRNSAKAVIAERNQLAIMSMPPAGAAKGNKWLPTSVLSAISPPKRPAPKSISPAAAHQQAGKEPDADTASNAMAAAA